MKQNVVWSSAISALYFARHGANRSFMESTVSPLAVIHGIAGVFDRPPPIWRQPFTPVLHWVSPDWAVDELDVSLRSSLRVCVYSSALTAGLKHGLPPFAVVDDDISFPPSSVRCSEKAVYLRQYPFSSMIVVETFLLSNESSIIILFFFIEGSHASGRYSC